MQDLHSAWVEFTMPEPNPFPRDVGKYMALNTRNYLDGGYPRFKVNNEVEYLDFLDKNRYKGAMCGVAGDNMIQNRMLSKLKLEIGDNSSLHIAYRHLRSFCKGLIENYNAIPTITYTGNRSFYVFIPFRPVQLTCNSNIEEIVITDIVQTLWEKNYYPDFSNFSLIINNIDWKVVKDRNRVMRPPYTMHVKLIVHGLKRFVVPIMYNDKLSDIVQYSIDGKSNIDFELNDRENWDVRKLVQDTDLILYNTEKNIENNIRNSGKNKQCTIKKGEKFGDIVQYLFDNAASINDGRHRILFHLLAPALANLNIPHDEAILLIIDWITKTGEDPNKYVAFASYIFKRVDENNVPFYPMSLEKFNETYPDLLRCK